MSRANLLFLMLMIFGCKNSSEPSLPTPAKIKMVDHSNDMAAVETGIDAVPESNGIKLQWFNPHDHNLKIYSVYRRLTQETYFKIIKTIDLETAFPGQDTVYIDNDPNLPLNRYNYYYVTATNTDDLEGPSSDTLRYYLLEKSETDQPNGLTLSGLPTFYWSFPQTMTPPYFILRIEDEYTNSLFYIAKFESNYDDPAQILDLKQVANPPTFQSGGAYRWRIDSIGPDSVYSGAESAWKIFYIN